MNYEVTIDSLTTAGGPKSKIEGHEDIRLGYWSSIRPAFSKYNIGETPSSEIVYHYWVPYLAIFEFEPPHTIDCNNADDAYAYPNTCCWEFPETCCTSAGNAEKNVPSIKEVYDNSNEEVKKKIENTCCTNEPTIKFNTYTLPTFNSLDKKEEFLDNFPGKICPACSWTPNSDRYCCNEPPYKGSSYCPSDEETDKYCEDNDYFNKHKDICCQKDKYKNDTTKCPRPSDSCDDEEFFNNNKTMCCQQDKYKNDTTKCPVPTESCDDNKFFETNKNICCKLEKYVNDARCISKTNACTDETYFEGHKSTCCSDFSKDPNSSLWKTNAWQCCNEEDITNEAKATCDIPYVEPKNQSCDKDNSFDLKTTINGKNSFTETLSISAVDPYKNGSDNAKPKVSAGQGFKYDIHVKDKIVLDSNSTYPKGTANMNCNSVSSAFETYNKSIEDALKKIKADAIRKQIIYFKEDGSTESNYKFKYVYREAGKENELIDSINSKKVNVKKENTSVACIDYYYNPYSGINVPYNSSTNVTIYKPEITIDIDYDMTLPTYYISNNSNINDETEHTISDKNSPLYINGGNQFYTNVYDKTLKNGENARGTYWKGFSIQVENGGITVDNEGDETGRLKTTDSNKYTCSYRISKCLTEGSCPKDDNNTRFPSSSVSDAKEDYYSRPISLTTPFPNLRESGPNWNGTAKNGTFDLPTTYITSGTPTNPKGDKVYSKAMYSIKLTPELINNIKKYNNSQNDHGGYLDWEMTSYDDYKRTSKFLSCLNGTTSDCTTNMRSAGLNAKKTLNITLSDEARKNKIGEF